MALTLPLGASSKAERESAPSAPGTPALCYSPDPDGFYEPIGLREETDYVVLITVPCDREEAAALWSKSRASQTAWPFANPRLRPALNLMPPDMWHEVTAGEGKATVVHGLLNFGSFVGTVDLTLGDSEDLRAEVACSKLGYYDDFKALLNGVTADLVELLFEIDSTAGFRLTADERTEAHPAVLLFHLRRLFAQGFLPLAVEAVMRQPHSILSETLQLMEPGAAHYIDPRRVAWLTPTLAYRRGGPAAHLFWGLTPLQLPETRKQDVYDTPENRFVKAFLAELSLTCQTLVGMLRQENKAASLREASAWENLVYEWLTWPIWREVGEMSHFPSNSQVLLRRSGYREILEAYLTLRYGIRLPWQRGLELAEVIGDLRPIFELYEYWCFFALRRALRAICGPERSDSLYDVREDRLEIRLRRGRSSELRYTYTSSHGEADVSLFYNRQFRAGRIDSDYRDASYTTSFRPDFSVLVTAGPQRHWLHFDAKYRLDRQSWQQQVVQPTFEQIEQELSGSDDGPDFPPAPPEPGLEHLASDPEDLELYQRSDLYKMHTYRDALLGARGAYVLFPGAGAETAVFVRHRSHRYRSQHHLPGVGAFPLRPSSTFAPNDSDQLEALTAFLRGVFSTLTHAAGPYQEETGLHDHLAEDHT